jgi:hypothetical protein
MINRHNYEEYFLLYVDNELDEAQRAAVEDFVQQNPDVAGELEMFKHATLLADDTTEFESKNLLYKTATGISLANYEEYFLLAVDKELGEGETAELEKFILQHPQLQDEYTLLQQATLPADTIPFEHKSMLYRTEEKKRRIPVVFMRMAVAASIVGLVATLWMVSQNSNINPDGNPPVVQQKASSSPQKSNEIKVADAVTPQQVVPLHNRDTHGEEVANISRSRKKATLNIVNTVQPATVTLKVEDKVVRPKEIAVAEAPKPSPKQTIAENTPEQEINNNSQVNSIDKTVARLNYPETHSMTNDRSIVKPAVYQEIAIEEEEDNSIYIGAAEFNKTKLKGLLRKAVNFLDKKTHRNDSDKTVQIASFQFKSR